MTEIFISVVNMSITAGITAAVVLILRLVLKKAPKWVSVLLWGTVALRLICPFAVESQFSLMPQTDWIENESGLSREDLIYGSTFESIDIYPIADSSLGKDLTVTDRTAVEPQTEIRRGVNIPFVLSCVWIAGTAVLLLHTVRSTVRLRRSIGTAIHLCDNVWESSAVESPFVLGVISPRIYVPRGMTEEKLAYVIAHEQTHILRRDHLWKPFGYLLLTVHWFNPVMWLSYILLCRDIEMACDEQVIKDMGEVERADYSEALLECTVNRRMISACPLAFGEVNVKQRIESVLNYRKPAFWIVAVAVIACAVVSVCFLTDPTTVINASVSGIRFPVNDPLKAKECTVEISGEIAYDTFRGTVTVDGRRIETTVDMERDTPTLSYYRGSRLTTYGLFFILNRSFTEFALEIVESDEYVVCGLSLEKFEEKMARKNYYVAYLHDIVLYDASNANREQVFFNINTEGRTVVLYGKYLDPDMIADRFYFGDNVVGKPRSGTHSHTTVYYACMSTCLDGKVYTKQCSTTFADDFSDADIDSILSDCLDLSSLRKSAYEFRQDRIENYSIPETAPVYDEKAFLTLEDVIELSAKGADLIWEDFAEYSHTDVGSGLYIWHLPIDEVFSVKVGGVSPIGTPMYIYLYAKSGDAEERIDIRDGGLEEFIRQYHTLPSYVHYGGMELP